MARAQAAPRTELMKRTLQEYRISYCRCEAETHARMPCGLSHLQDIIWCEGIGIYIAIDKVSLALVSYETNFAQNGRLPAFPVSGLM